MIYASKKNKIGAEVTLVTPEMASKWLGNTADFQRNISPIRVSSYLKAMRRGEWKITPSQSIAISQYGQIIDGQHRLKALVDYGQPLEMSIVFNCPIDSFDVIDQGYKRSVAQIASMRGEKFSNRYNIAAVNTLSWSIKDGNLSFSDAWSAKDCIYIMNRYRAEMEAVFPNNCQKYSNLTVAAFRGAALRVAISKRHLEDLSQVSDFVKVVTTGLPLDDGRIFKMALMLRNVILSNQKLLIGTGSVNKKLIYKSTLLAFRHYLRGTEIKTERSFKNSVVKVNYFPIEIDSKPDYQSVKDYLKSDLYLIN